ncbi:MAG: hypothetical protein IH786_10515, partial [Proteobacteria bacterium]|nr:hypothetical protein [Pseudomonadota bacterium]
MRVFLERLDRNAERWLLLVLYSFIVYVIFIEVGGTVGDYENSFYIEALRELAFEEGPQSTCFVALTYIIEPAILGEQKSKAAQLGIKQLMEAGVQPHILACRARNPVTEMVM